MDPDIKSSEVIFFFGAGASISAGVPDTYTFIDQYVEFLTEKSQKDTIKKIINTLEKWKGSKIDIELLLETLTKLENKNDEPLLEFFKNKEFTLKQYPDKVSLIDELKDFIKSKAIVSEDKIQYLKPLLGFIREYKTIDIISMNYDICLEQFCNVFKLTYRDGFDVYWNPKNFTSEHTDIRLYKLHGSVTWYQSDQGGYIKLPVMTEESKIQLITGERADNLMLYPMQKWDYPEPLLEMMVIAKNLIESENCKYLVVVGYSFRDEQIRRIIWDVARKNHRLHLIIIDPNAYKIYIDRLKYYDSSHQIPSSLEGKVICLPYPFKNALMELKNRFLKNLITGLSTEENQNDNEIKGESFNWPSFIRDFLIAEYNEKVEQIQINIKNHEYEIHWQLYLELSLQMGLNFLMNKDNEKANFHLKNFNESIDKFFIEGINARYIEDRPPSIELIFNYIIPDKIEDKYPPKTIDEEIKSLFAYCQIKYQLCDDPPETLTKLSNKFERIISYLEPFKSLPRIKLNDYIILREDDKSNHEKIKQMRKDLQATHTKNLSEELESEIRNIEKNILREILRL